LSVALFVFLTACQAASLSYVGTLARPGNRLELEEGPERRGTWQTPDLVVNYQYRQAGQSLELTAEVNLTGHLRRGYTSASNVYLGVHFLNAENRVIASRNFSLSGFRAPIRKWRITRRLEVPAEANAIAFSYTGRVSEGGGFTTDEGGGGTSWDFWQRP
jgi:hypothetical protein